MDLNEKPTILMESELELKDQEIARCDTGQFKKPYQDDGRRSCVAMEKGYLEHEVWKRDYQVLQSRLNGLEFQKIELEREVKVLREKNEELELRIITSIENGREVNYEDVLEGSQKNSLRNDENLMDSDEESLWLKIENNVLQCEKQNAEREVENWKHKCNELKTRLLALQGRSGFSGERLASLRENEELLDVDSSVHVLTSPSCHTPVVVDEVTTDAGICFVKTPDKSVNFKQGIQVINLDGVRHSSHSRKQLFCEDDMTNKKIAPHAPSGASPRTTFTTDTANVLPSGRQGYAVLTPFASKEVVVPYSKPSTNIGHGGEDTSDCSEKIPFVVTPKRKRSQYVVTSDTESEDDDNIPIGQLVRKNLLELAPQPVVSDCDANADLTTRRRHRLVKLSQFKGRKNPKTDESENDDSMKSFIVSSSDVSECEEEASDVPEDISDSIDDFDGILHRIRRSKDDGSKWELEGDMLAAFGKDPMLCMKAVCALYRQQTCDEQEHHGTFVYNGRGFSKFDALRGSELAEFLTDKVPNGDLTKSVEQLNEFDPNGVERCRTLAARYSKQLFEIYTNGEDPYFFPS